MTEPQDDSFFSGIKGIVWDLDNTLYRLEEAHEHAFNLAVAKSVLTAGVELTLEEASALGRRSFEEFGYSGAIFVQKYGVSAEQLHYDFHSYLDETIIHKSHEMRNLFAAINLPHALITHSARGWAERVLLHLDLLDWFPKERTFGLENYNFERKSDSAHGFRQALASLELEPHDTLIIEDTMVNLKIPHDMGMKTAYIHHGRPPAEIAPYVRLSTANAIEIMTRIKTAQTKQVA